MEVIKTIMAVIGYIAIVVIIILGVAYAIVRRKELGRKAFWTKAIWTIVGFFTGICIIMAAMRFGDWYYMRFMYGR